MRGDEEEEGDGEEDFDDEELDDEDGEEDAPTATMSRTWIRLREPAEVHPRRPTQSQQGSRQIRIHLRRPREAPQRWRRQRTAPLLFRALRVGPFHPSTSVLRHSRLAGRLQDASAAAEGTSKVMDTRTVSSGFCALPGLWERTAPPNTASRPRDSLSPPPSSLQRRGPSSEETADVKLRLARSDPWSVAGFGGVLSALARQVVRSRERR